jgi:hypothetical protein
MTREEMRQVLSNYYGCRQAGLDVASQRDTILDVSRLLTKVFQYTPDNQLKTDPFLNIKKGKPEQWVSRHVDLVMRKTPLFGDCDDYTMTGIQCALILGVNPSRLAAVAVVDDVVIRSSIAVRPMINHIVGGFLDGQEWLACFDTWNEDPFQEYLPKIGIGRRPARKDRHSGQLISIISEGLRWRTFEGGWFKQT